MLCELGVNEIWEWKSITRDNEGCSSRMGDFKIGESVYVVQPIYKDRARAKSMCIRFHWYALNPQSH